MVVAYTPCAVINRMGLSGETCWYVNVLVSHLLLLFVIFMTPALRFTNQIQHRCLVQPIAGAPCPGCGVTTCVQAASEGELKRAIEANPAGLAFLGGLFAQAVLHLAALCWPNMNCRVACLSSLLNCFVLACRVAV